MNSDYGFYQKQVWSFAFPYLMIAEYLNRCLADLDSVSYILVGITVVVEKA
jgi:hypothetical protein